MKLFYGLTICVAAGCLWLIGCAQQQAQTVAEGQTVLTVQAARAQERTIARSIFVTGSLLPDETVTISSEVAGRVAKVYVDFGQNVRKGQPLIELDTRELELRLARTRGALSQALARLGLEGNTSAANVRTTPSLDQARALLEETRFKFESGKQLVASGDISRERFQELERAIKQQQAGVEAAEYDLRTQLASVQALEAEVKLAEKAVADARQYAPFDGSITERMVSVGQYMKENTPMMTLVKAWPLRLRLEVPENASAAVKEGRAVRFQTDALPDEVFEATVRELNAQLETRSRTLTAEARVTRTDARLRPGMFVRVELVTDPSAPILVVPATSVHTIAGLTKVFVLNGGTATERKVPPPTYRENGWVDVPASALKSGDLVATSELPALYDGLRVNVEESKVTAQRSAASTTGRSE
ncbi:MAG: efflux RND transporter periplasmic adaptor subunit [Bryobacterales bacterium]|nr:efflux RND transporter periplasmic adaptor subunit [Bryobacterales bacterium]